MDSFNKKPLLLILLSVSFQCCSICNFVNISPSDIGLSNQDWHFDNPNLAENESETYYMLKGNSFRQKKYGTWDLFWGQDFNWYLVGKYHFKDDQLDKVKKYDISNNLTSIYEQIDSLHIRRTKYDNDSVKVETIEGKLKEPIDYDDSFSF